MKFGNEGLKKDLGLEDLASRQRIADLEDQIVGLERFKASTSNEAEKTQVDEVLDGLRKQLAKAKEAELRK